MRARYEFTVEGISAFRVLDKLKNADIEVFRADPSAKNRITFEVAAKNAKKVFAILRGSCYNVVEGRARGLALFYKKALTLAGLLAGAVFFCIAVLLMQTRVLAVEIVGNGACYETEIFDALGRGGVKKFSAMPEHTEAITAEILSLPRVSYCSMSHSGGVLTVDVRVSDDLAPLEVLPLMATRAGVVTELVVVRGTARVGVGDAVEEGQILVDCVAAYGEIVRPVAVVARARIAFPVAKEYPGSEEAARSAALLEYGEISHLSLQKTERGWLVTGEAAVGISLNL